MSQEVSELRRGVVGFLLGLALGALVALATRGEGRKGSGKG